MPTDETDKEDSVIKAARGILQVILIVSLASCAANEANRIQSHYIECMEPIQSGPQYATARETLDPNHGITPSMLADNAYPDANDRRGTLERFSMQPGAGRPGPKDQLQHRWQHDHLQCA